MGFSRCSSSRCCLKQIESWPLLCLSVACVCIYVCIRPLHSPNTYICEREHVCRYARIWQPRMAHSFAITAPVFAFRYFLLICVASFTFHVYVFALLSPSHQLQRFSRFMLRDVLLLCWQTDAYTHTMANMLLAKTESKSHIYSAISAFCMERNWLIAVPGLDNNLGNQCLVFGNA